MRIFLKKNPNGLRQIIKEDGQNISGGEKQRIGIARALLNNPKIIILDEATSGLDSFTEMRVLETINKIKKTIIIVSHRINTLKFCDKVYNIEKNTLKLINKSNLFKNEFGAFLLYNGNFFGREGFGLAKLKEVS